MKTRTLNRTLPAIVLGALVCLASPAGATSLYRSGTGDWDTLNAVWGTTSGGPYNVATWNNGNNDTAVFEVTSGTSTLTEGITVGGIIFNVRQVVSANTLTLASGTALRFNVGNGNTTGGEIGSILAGSNGFTKTGTGWLNLIATSSSLSGDIKIESGTLYTRHEALGTGGIVFTGNSTLSKVYNANGSFPATMSLTVNPGVSATIAGGSFYWNANFAGVLAGDTTSALTVSPGGNVEFQFNNTANTFTGKLTVSGGGTADNGGRGVFKSLPDSSEKIVISDSVFRLASGGVAMNFANRPIEILNNARIDNDSTTGTTATMTFAKNLTATIGNNAKTLTLSGVNTGDNTFGGNITNSATGSGAVSVTKSEAGRWVLSGTNTYTGTTLVSLGTLVLKGEASIKDTGTLNIAGGKVEVATREKIAVLQYSGVAQASGTYGSTASGATNQDDTRFLGTGVLYVGVDFPPPPPSGTMIMLK